MQCEAPVGVPFSLSVSLSLSLAEEINKNKVCQSKKAEARLWPRAHVLSWALPEVCLPNSCELNPERAGTASSGRPEHPGRLGNMAGGRHGEEPTGGPPGQKGPSCWRPGS